MNYWWLRLAVLLILTCVLSPAGAQYPDRPIRILVPFSPGGGTDILARMIGQKLTQSWGKQVVVDNRTGANGIVAAELTAQANPDGYTLLFVAIGHAINPLIIDKLPYDTEKDFTPISLTAVLPLILAVHPSVKATTVRELIALAKSSPQPMSYASGGIGSSQHLATALMSHMAKLNLTHIPYKGGAPGLVEVIAGHVNMMISTVLSMAQPIKTGRIRGLAVSTLKRNSALPDLPTIAEAGIPGYESVAWYGIVGPAHMPQAVLSKLSGQIVKDTRSKEMWETLLAQGAEPVGNTPREFTAFIKAEMTKYRDVVKEAGVKAD
jgi:tripartite-type tricarboxylate transporter receptor subunit TctC